MEIFKIVLSSGVGAGIMAIILAAIQRHWKKKDEKEARGGIDPELFKALVAAQKVTMIDRIRYLGTCYICEREISLEDKETIEEMYAAYKALGGNGHLKTVMEEIERLPVITRKDD